MQASPGGSLRSMWDSTSTREAHAGGDRGERTRQGSNAPSSGWRQLRRLVGEIPWAVLGVGRAGGGRAVGVISVWAGWERLNLWLHHLEPARPGSLFRFRVQSYPGPDHALEDGTVVRRGDAVVELHLDNRAFAARRSKPGYSTWKMVHDLRGDLQALRSRVGSGELGPVVAVHGVSLMGPAGGVLGFETNELPRSLRNAFVYYFLAGLDAVYHPAGLQRIKGRQVRRRWPAEIWMACGAPRVKA